MVIVPKIKYEDTLRYYFAMDKELIDEYHIEAPNTIDACVERTLEDISALQHYVMFNEPGMFYFGVEDGKHLTSFFIAPEQRTKEGIEHFWTNVEFILGNEFICGLYKKNIRAIEFIKRAGGVSRLEVENGIYFLVERN